MRHAALPEGLPRQRPVDANVVSINDEEGSKGSLAPPGHHVTPSRGADGRTGKVGSSPPVSRLADLSRPHGNAGVVVFARLFVRPLERDDTYDEPNLKNSRPRAGRRV